MQFVGALIEAKVCWNSWVFHQRIMEGCADRPSLVPNHGRQRRFLDTLEVRDLLQSDYVMRIQMP
jgi:hypothetical protein